MQLRTCFRFGAVSSGLVAFLMLTANSASDLEMRLEGRVSDTNMFRVYFRPGRGASGIKARVGTTVTVRDGKLTWYGPDS